MGRTKNISNFYLPLRLELLLLNSFRVLSHAAKACFYKFLQVLRFKVQSGLVVFLVLQHSTTATNSANHLKVMQSHTHIQGEFDQRQRANKIILVNPRLSEPHWSNATNSLFG